VLTVWINRSARQENTSAHGRTARLHAAGQHFCARTEKHFSALARQHFCARTEKHFPALAGQCSLQKNCGNSDNAAMRQFGQFAGGSHSFRMRCRLFFEYGISPVFIV